jgi:putative FmdB family regulatory protein
MPIFEYVCRDCQHHFETLVRGSASPTCPACESKQLEKQLSVFAVNSRGMESMPAPGPCGTCGDPRGPGACSIN